MAIAALGRFAEFGGSRRARPRTRRPRTRFTGLGRALKPRTSTGWRRSLLHLRAGIGDQGAGPAPIRTRQPTMSPVRSVARAWTRTRRDRATATVELGLRSPCLRPWASGLALRSSIRLEARSPRAALSSLWPGLAETRFERHGRPPWRDGSLGPSRHDAVIGRQTTSRRRPSPWRPGGFAVKASVAGPCPNEGHLAAQRRSSPDRRRYAGMCRRPRQVTTLVLADRDRAATVLPWVTWPMMSRPPAALQGLRRVSGVSNRPSRPSDSARLTGDVAHFLGDELGGVGVDQRRDLCIAPCFISRRHDRRRALVMRFASS
ncbi:hypothetical protein FQR65_LT20864 [Abscondita terminalis]|nr:hypothetical protein FQR65_LT20864 [Abscondita terminalis]